jgi:hypothetical protein
VYQGAGRGACRGVAALPDSRPEPVLVGDPPPDRVVAPRLRSAADPVPEPVFQPRDGLSSPVLSVRRGVP